MTTLLLRLEGPMQSWGTESRFGRRSTDSAPSRSGVFGLLAAARGMRRTDDLTELLSLRFGTRVDQPGRLLRDYQTARHPRAKHATLSERFYLADGRFLAAVEGDDGMVRGLAEALKRPHFPPFLGRRSCPPASPVFYGLTEDSLETALADSASWLVPEHDRWRFPPTVRLEVAQDAVSSQGDLVRDNPVSFDPTHRQYRFRRVRRYQVEIPNAHSNSEPVHDPFAALGG